MRKSVVIACFLSFSNAFSASVETKEDKTYLKSSDCYELSSDVDSILEWRAARKQSEKKNPLNCDNLESLEYLDPAERGIYSIDISAFLPTFARNSQRKVAYCDGPNCFNNVLVELGMLNRIRYSHKTELNYYLDTYCAELSGKADEGPRPGDIGVIRKKGLISGFSTLHAFTYVGSLSWTKNGAARGASYRLEPLATTLNLYGVNKETCKTITGMPSACRTYATYFRCDRVPTAIGNPNDPIERVDRSLSDLASHGKTKVPLWKSSDALGPFPSFDSWMRAIGLRKATQRKVLIDSLHGQMAAIPVPEDLSPGN